jgi:hypothetical protein
MRRLVCFGGKSKQLDAVMGRRFRDCSQIGGCPSE